MSPNEKSELWWQKSDYDDFRKAARIITRSMLQRGNEIWFQSSSNSSKDQSTTNEKLATSPAMMMNSNTRIAMAMIRRFSNCSLAEQQTATVESNSFNANKAHEQTIDKWWHIFGHSRRGLEHIASIDEGRIRQANVRASIRLVLEEQARQQLYRNHDPLRIRAAYVYANSWARELALASGASDADAVKENFDDRRRKSREFYLLNRRELVTSEEQKQQAVDIKSKLISENPLDVNTFPHNDFRQLQEKKRRANHLESVPTQSAKSGSEHFPSECPVSKKAAGFCASQEDTPNMSALLTGSGPLRKRSR